MQNLRYICIRMAPEEQCSITWKSYCDIVWTVVNAIVKLWIFDSTMQQILARPLKLRRTIRFTRTALHYHLQYCQCYIQHVFVTWCLVRRAFIVSLIRVTYKAGFGLDDWIYCTLYIHNSALQAFTALSLIYTLQFTVTHALGFSVFTSRILATNFHTVVIPVSLSLQHTWSLLCTVKFPSCNFFSVTFDCHLQNSTQFSAAQLNSSL
jgi:hypothetical protein